MAIPSSGTISMLDLAKEFDSTSVGSITSLSNYAGTNVWVWALSGSGILVGDILFRDDFAFNDFNWGRVTASSGSGIEVVWFGRPGSAAATDNGALPYVGMPVRRARAVNNLSDYYRGGARVPNIAGNAAIPTSGPISLANFQGTANQQVYQRVLPGAGLDVITVPAGTWYVYVVAVGAGGGGGAGDGGLSGTPGGFGGSLRAKFTVNAGQTGSFVLATGNGGTAGTGAANAGRGGFGGRSYSWANNTNPSPANNNNGLEGQFYSTFNQGDPNSWEYALEVQAVWSPFFDSQGLNSRVPVSIFFPTTGVYDFIGLSDNRLNIYIDTTNDQIGTAGTFDGFATLKQVSRTVTSGWHTVYFSAENSGGSKGIGLGINRQSDGLQIFRTRGLVGGGFYSGNWWFLNGGEGGASGSVGTSGAGGGGGAGSALLWYPFNNYLTSALGAEILAIAPGGGGGAGTGSGINPNSAGGIYSANWSNRPVTTNVNDVTGAELLGNILWWTSRSPGNRVPYNILQGLRGQGATHSGEFFPPGTDNGWNAEVNGWDGGAGGGGGAPWGYAGGYAERSGSNWSLSGTWTAPFESAGSGGNQGFILLHSSFVNNYLTSRTNTYYPAFGAPGLGRFIEGNSSNGQPGAIAVRVSNIDDGIYPTL